MPGPFDYFAVIAGMRTGSNLLEEWINAHPQLSCHGELFNPHFVGRPDQSEALGVQRAARDADPALMLDAVRWVPDTLAGFRIFDGHHPSALTHVLADPRCAKVILTRNPIDSYVSLKIAKTTKQWWLGDLKSAQTRRVRFDGPEFAEFLDGVTTFRSQVRRAIQQSGQCAFWLTYDDLADDSVIQGIYSFLGCKAARPALRPQSKVQNPDPLQSKVSNFDDMADWLARLDPFELDRIPGFDAMRGAGVPGFRCALTSRLVFMPIGDVATEPVDRWMTDLADGTPPQRDMTQSDLKAWMRKTEGHRRFTVIEHPLPRAYDVFRFGFLDLADVRFDEMRSLSASQLDLTVEGIDLESPASQKAAFLGFLKMVSGSLAGQTGLRLDPSWVSQTSRLEAISRFAAPDIVIRRDALSRGLARLAEDVGVTDAPMVEADRTKPVSLTALLRDDDVRRAVRQAYRRDFVQFGFGDWP